MSKSILFIVRFFVILVTVGFQTITAQEPLFDSTIQMLPKGKMKVFLSEKFSATPIKCAEFYMVGELEDHKYQLKDSLHVFYIDNNLFLKGFYKNGKRHGKFKTFYKNGGLKTDFEYNEGVRQGIWKSYYQNGSLKKTVVYNNGNEFLINFNSEDGKELVKEGIGKFSDQIIFSERLGKSLVKGEVNKGLPDGEWNFLVGDKIFAKEYFEDFRFLKGISISPVLGNRLYYNYFHASFTGEKPIEFLNIDRSYFCQESIAQNKKNGIPKIYLSEESFLVLQKAFEKQELSEIIDNEWFFLKTHTDKKDKLVDVEILSKAGDEKVEIIRNLIYQKWKKFAFSKLRNFIGNTKNIDVAYFVIIVKDGKLESTLNLEKKFLL